MELSSTITATWKVCAIGSLLGCLVLFLLNQDNQNITLLAVTNTALEFAAPLPQPDAVNTILNPTHEPSIFSNSSSPPPIAMASMVSEPPQLSNYSKFNGIEKPKEIYHTEKPNVIINVSKVEKPKKKIQKKCNMFDGRWVYKPESKPSYIVQNCPFLEEKMSCQRNGRPDFEYEKWIWEATDCDIPMLNGTDMVERFRNKRVVLVGDSLNRNMWESLACILYSSIPNASTKVEVHSDIKVLKTFFKAKEEYNFTVDFFWSPFLVELNKNHSSGKKVLVLDKLSSNSELWPEADIMLFNSGHWWAQTGSKRAWDMYEYKGKLIKDMPLHIAYKRAMNTWAKWIEKKVDSTKTALFFRSVSAEHKAPQYNQACQYKTKPIMDESYRNLFPKKLIPTIESVIKGMKSQVKYLNITKLSGYRIDAHPSIYRYNDWKIRAKKDIRTLTAYADCGHWCLPGIPDTWNRLFYASLYFDTFDVSSNS
ncbi:hypothetical protein BVRB_9g210120 [Beta vulgaris subsp. vulgaris]|nr:hypothetical protein BVRB_9g210120 [Beta vulgaris subsp. vulgaris]